MTFEAIGEFLVNNGIAVVVTVYFLWKDSKLTKDNTEILMQVKALFDILVKKENVGANL